MEKKKLKAEKEKAAAEKQKVLISSGDLFGLYLSYWCVF